MIVIIIIVVAFVRQAGELGLNKWKWGAIGFAAYTLTQLILGMVIGLGVEMAGGRLETGMELVLNIIGIIVGGVAAYVAYQKMPEYAAEEQTSSHSDLLDEDMFR